MSVMASATSSSRRVPSTGATAFWYDAHGNKTKRVDARSIETDQTYERSTRITKTDTADSAENITATL